jgi:hypothetical protein
VARRQGVHTSSAEYEHGSIILTTNRGIVLTITGDGYRMRRHRDAIAGLRPALTGRRGWGILVIAPWEFA